MPKDSRNEAPELISYLDITRGRWENFELLDPQLDPVTHAARIDPITGQPVMVRTRPYRWGVEGRLKIPGTPFQIGFDGNLGKGPDDLRFLFGVKFDIGKLLSNLKTAESLGVK